MAWAAPPRAQEADGLNPTITDDAPDAPAPNSLALKPLPSIDDIQAQEDIARSKTPIPVTIDPYAPQGIDAGGLRLFPSLEVGGEFTSNVAQSPDDAQSALGLAVKPGLRLESDWVRHQWTGSVNGDFVLYPKFSENDRREVSARSDLRVDIRRQTIADIGVFYDLNQELPGTDDVPDAADEARVDQVFGATAALTQNLGAFDAQARVGVAREIYGDVELNSGATEDNSDRDLTAPSGGLRLTYSAPPVLKPFVDVGVTSRIHDERRDRNGLRRDSIDIETQAGVVIDNGPFWSGEVALAYIRRFNKDAALDDISAVGINGNLTWRPTDLTSVVLTAATDLNGTSSGVSSGSKLYAARLEVTQSLRENVELSAGVGATFEKFEDGTDKTFDADVALAWQFTPEWAWTMSYGGTWFEGAFPDDDYTEHRIMTGIVLRR
jgi:hypothetical protein